MSWSVGTGAVEKSSLAETLNTKANESHLEGDTFEQFETARDAALDIADSLDSERVSASLSGHVGDGSQTNKSSISVYVSEA
jgi:hypothetical protein